MPLSTRSGCAGLCWDLDVVVCRTRSLPAEPFLEEDMPVDAVLHMKCVSEAGGGQRPWTQLKGQSAQGQQT